MLSKSPCWRIYFFGIWKWLHKECQLLLMENITVTIDVAKEERSSPHQNPILSPIVILDIYNGYLIH